MSTYTTEITSDSIPSDNPLHQRLLQAYYLAIPYVNGDLLEIGCGEGRGIKVLSRLVQSYTAIDKNQEVIDRLSSDYPTVNFMQRNIPPFKGISNNQFHTIVAFQVIEHIEKDHYFLKEIHRMLKPGGKAIITTPNVKMTLSRNPWHIREYTAEQLEELVGNIFSKVEMKGVKGSERVMTYYEANRKSVRNIMKYDIFNLQYNLPSWMLRKPYEILNRMNRKKLENQDTTLVESIHRMDYSINEKSKNNLDLFCVLTK